MPGCQGCILPLLLRRLILPINKTESYHSKNCRLFLVSIESPEQQKNTVTADRRIARTVSLSVGAKLGTFSFRPHPLLSSRVCKV